jgi:phosphoesterase RecJ-like protein
MGRALERARPLAGGRLLASVLTQEDFDAAGGDDTEGIVEVMRGVRGVQAAALVREAGPAGSYRVSLRASDPAVDVAQIAGEEGGGGHRAAAGFSTRRAPDDLLAWLESRIAPRLDRNGADG